MAGSEEVLLQYLDARVHVQVAQRLRGTVCVGVRRQGRMAWWIARFGERIATEFTGALPAAFDAGIAVDDRTALWILGAVAEPGGLHLTTGDASLLQSFVSDYLRYTDAVAIRLRGAL